MTTSSPRIQPDGCGCGATLRGDDKHASGCWVNAQAALARNAKQGMTMAEAKRRLSVGARAGISARELLRRWRIKR